MIVDSSAVVAIIRDEADSHAHARALAEAAQHVPAQGKISAATLAELSIVVDAMKDPGVSARLDEILADNLVAVVPFTAEHARIARQAHRDFGRRSGHPAKLNMGDCFSYALANATREPLLYKGDDFVHTDVRGALPR